MVKYRKIESIQIPPRFMNRTYIMDLLPERVREAAISIGITQSKQGNTIWGPKVPITETERKKLVKIFREAHVNSSTPQRDDFQTILYAVDPIERRIKMERQKRHQNSYRERRKLNGRHDESLAPLQLNALVVQEDVKEEVLEPQPGVMDVGELFLAITKFINHNGKKQFLDLVRPFM